MKKFLILGLALFALAFGAGCGPVEEGAGSESESAVGSEGGMEGGMKDGEESDEEGAAKDEAMKDMGSDEAAGMTEGAEGHSKDDGHGH